MPALYETDFYAWTQEQAKRLRASEPVGVGNIAEELETLGRSEQQQLINRLAVLIQHLPKIDHQSDKQTPGWTATIKEQRRRVRRLLEVNPSLKPKLGDCIQDAYPTAVTFASVETGILEEDFPEECPYSAEILLSIERS